MTTTELVGQALIESGQSIMLFHDDLLSIEEELDAAEMCQIITILLSITGRKLDLTPRSLVEMFHEGFPSDEEWANM